MPLTLYEGAILLQHPGQGPTDHYRFDEQLGTTVNDTGIANLDLTTNGTVQRGLLSGLGGDPEGHSTGQSKDTVMATRGDSAIFDRPLTTNKLTVICWFRPDDLRSEAAGNQYVLVMKGASTYGLVVQGGKLRADISTQTVGLLSDLGNLIVPGRWNMAATTFDGAAQVWKLFFNGVLVGKRGLPSGQVIDHAAGGTLQVGGYNAFGNNGIHGRMQQVTIFNAHALGDNVIQDLYRLAVVPPGVEGDRVMYVFPGRGRSCHRGLASRPSTSRTPRRGRST